MRLGSLFAGIGGFDLGFEQSGFNTVWQVEIDDSCRNVLARHFPTATRFVDVRDVGAHNLAPVDVITFGSPCQDLSVAGQRKGLMDGERSNLFFEATRIIRECKPALAIWENVPGVFSSNGGRDFAAVLHELGQCGARDIAWRVLNAQYFGVAQRRRRVFLVADFSGERAGQILFESDSVPGDFTESGETGKDIAGTLTQGFGSRGLDMDQIANGAYAIQGFGDYIPSATASTIKTRDYKDATDLIVADTLTANWHRSNGAKAGNNAGMINPVINTAGVRRLTPTECERLQGFPDDWTADLADSTRYRQLGNAVCVNVARWIGQRVKRCVEGGPYDRYTETPHPYRGSGGEGAV